MAKKPDSGKPRVTILKVARKRDNSGGSSDSQSPSPSFSPPSQAEDKPKNLVIRKEGFKNLVLQKGANKETDGRIVRINRIEGNQKE
jgi:hypothetical protein